MLEVRRYEERKRQHKRSSLFLSWITLLLLLVNFILPTASAQLVLFTISTYSLAQTAVPNQLLGRVITVTRILTWSTASLGALLGGLAIERTHNVGLIYAVIGLLIFGITLTFFLTPLGHTERYLPKDESSMTVP